jgi:hypothetical protein
LTLCHPGHSFPEERDIPVISAICRRIKGGARWYAPEGTVESSLLFSRR